MTDCLGVVAEVGEDGSPQAPGGWGCAESLPARSRSILRQPLQPVSQAVQHHLGIGWISSGVEPRRQLEASFQQVLRIRHSVSAVLRSRPACAARRHPSDAIAGGSADALRRPADCSRPAPPPPPSTAGSQLPAPWSGAARARSAPAASPIISRCSASNCHASIEFGFSCSARRSAPMASVVRPASPNAIASSMCAGAERDCSRARGASISMAAWGSPARRRAAPRMRRAWGCPGTAFRISSACSTASLGSFSRSRAA